MTSKLKFRYRPRKYIWVILSPKGLVVAASSYSEKHAWDDFADNVYGPGAIFAPPGKSVGYQDDFVRAQKEAGYEIRKIKAVP